MAAKRKMRLATFCSHCGAEILADTNGDVCAGCGQVGRVMKFTRRKKVELLPLFPGEQPELGMDVQRNKKSFTPRQARLAGEMMRGLRIQLEQKGEG